MDNESLEDLQTGGLMLIQKKDGFRFGADAVLLSDFAKDIRAKNVLDMCTGSAVVPILLSQKSSAEKLFGIEIQDEIFEMANRSVKLNRLEDKIFLALGDIKNAAQVYGKRQFDLVTCNPPYMPAGCAVQNDISTKIIARHEVMCTLEDVISSAADVLKQQGHLVLVHKPARVADIICLMRKYDIEPKRIRLVHKRADSEPSLVLADGAYKGGRELRIMPPLFMYDENGAESAELRRIYGR